MGAPGSQPGPGGDRPRLSDARLPTRAPPSRARSGRSRGPVGLPAGEEDGGSPPHAPAPAHRGRASRRAPRRPRGRRLGPARAPVRRLRRQRGPRSRGEGGPVPGRRRPVRLQRPAAPLRGARRRGARPPRRGAHPHRARSPARTTSTTARPSTARTTWRRSPARPRATTWSPCSRRSGPGSTSAPATSSSTDPSSPRSGPRTARCGTSPRSGTPDATWRLGLLHAAIAIPGRTDHDEVVITTDEIAASGLDYLALGPLARGAGREGARRHVRVRGRSRARRPGPGQGRQGAPRHARAARGGQDRHGRGAGRRPDDLRAASRSTRRRSSRSPPSSPACAAAADQDRVLDVRLIGVRPDELDLDIAEVEEALRPDYLRVRVRDHSQPPLTDGALPPAETIAGAFIRTVEERIAALEGSPDTACGARGRGAARRPPPRPPAAGGPGGDAVRITSLSLRDLRRYRDTTIELAPGLTVVRGPNEAGKSTIQRAIELALTRKVTSAAGGARRARARGTASPDARPADRDDLHLRGRGRRRPRGPPREGVPRAPRAP